jgi:C4-dicarboxylate-specific signal transduction histidine kinase
VAAGCILAASSFAVSDVFPGVNWGLLAFIGAASLLYNFFLWRSDRTHTGPMGERAAMLQALIDIFILTGVLWAAGGVESPFMPFYVFHVALIGILAGPRAALVAAAVSVGCALFLCAAYIEPALRVGVWAPVAPWGVVTEVSAFVITVAGTTYIVTSAMREARDRERALKDARNRAALEYQLLSTTLSELDAGLEVIDSDGTALWRNKRAELLASKGSSENGHCPRQDRGCERDESERCPYVSASEHSMPGRCRFAAQVDRSERVYEMLSFPLSSEGERPRVMNLYLDRTQATLDERRLVTTERLVSLGRVAQGVAHELNTPLATIGTLAADMRAVIREIECATPAATEGREDLDESAALIQDETRRLGRITQALLAGGDLVRSHIDGAVPLGAVVERARALVFAGARGGPRVEIDPQVDELSVTADPDRLVQVLVNLLQNALDAVRDEPSGIVAVRAMLSEGQVELCIDDNGPGISADIESRLFEPFATTKPPGQGTGLGLYTSYMLAQAMGGTLVVEPLEGAGARAKIRLPLATRVASRLPLAQRAS